jgi:hypothetical protein
VCVCMCGRGGVSVCVCESVCVDVCLYVRGCVYICLGINALACANLHLFLGEYIDLSSSKETY